MATNGTRFVEYPRPPNGGAEGEGEGLERDASNPDEADEEANGEILQNHPQGSRILGDDLPHRGGRTGLMLGDDYGADLSPDADNRIGSIRSFTQSDPADQCRPPGDRCTHENPGSSDYVLPISAKRSYP